MDKFSSIQASLIQDSAKNSVHKIDKLQKNAWKYIQHIFT